MSSRDLEIFARIDQIELAAPPVNASTGIGDLMQEFATTPVRLAELIERYAGSPSAHVRAWLIVPISRRQYEVEFQESLLPLLLTGLLPKWTREVVHPESLVGLLSALDKEFRKGRHPGVDYAPLKKLVLECFETGRDVRLWETIYISAIDLLHTLTHMNELDAVFGLSDRPALRTALSRAVRLLVEKNEDAYESWIRDGYYVLKHIEHPPCIRGC